MRHRAYIHTIDIKFLYIEYSYMRLLIDQTIMRVVIMNVYIIIIEIQLGDSNIYYYYTVCMRVHVYLYVALRIHTYIGMNAYTHILIYEYPYVLIYKGILYV